jgi:hypothetical protein
MTEKNNFVKKEPDYTGDGVAVWYNLSTNNTPYLSIRLAGHNTVTAFLNDRNKNKDGEKQ